MAKVYTGTIGLKIIFILDEDITGYSSIVVNKKAPDGIETELSGFPSTLTNGTIYYITSSSADLSIAGTYRFQPVVILSDNTTLIGETVKLNVHHRYE
jgi:hypothetical protein